MTHEEIEGYRKRLNDLTAGLEAHPNKEQDIKKELSALARNVGTSTCVAYINNTGTYERCPAHTADLIHNIHEALQTASMANMCETAAEGHDIAVAATKGARKLQCTTIAVAIVGALGVCVSAGVALWVAFQK